jgi:hypothetical protein
MQLLRILLSSLFLYQSSATTPIPIITKSVQCSSSLISNGGNSANLTPDIEFHWKLKPDYVLQAAIRYQGVGWVALGFSPNGEMIGSRAFIGIPESTGIGSPKMYDLDSKAEDASGVIPTSYSYEVTGQVIQVNGLTTMVLETPNWRAAHYENGLYTFIVAVGQDNTLGFHKHASRFRLDLHVCGGTGLEYSDDLPPNAAMTATYDHKAAFIVHGFFATLAFAVVIPTAVASALFRSLMPKMWIYVHVICNCMGFLFAVIAVASAFGGMVMRSKATNASSDKPTHSDRIHHWIGLLLFLTVCWQVLNGFRRPPVEPKPELKVDQDDMIQDEILDKPSCCGIVKPESPREQWQLIHRSSAICIIVLAVYQMQAGIKLFMNEYSTKSPHGPLTAFWIWIALVAVGFVSLRCIVRRKDHQHSQIHRPGRNIMPQRDEELTSMRGSQFNVI